MSGPVRTFGIRTLDFPARSRVTVPPTSSRLFEEQSDKIEHLQGETASVLLNTSANASVIIMRPSKWLNRSNTDVTRHHSAGHRRTPEFPY